MPKRGSDILSWFYAKILRKVINNDWSREGYCCSLMVVELVNYLTGEIVYDFQNQRSNVRTLVRTEHKGQTGMGWYVNEQNTQYEGRRPGTHKQFALKRES